jgi:hypothetical protein
MQKRWKEIWAAGEGNSRIYCGIARTVDGYAVDLFRGDSCVASEIHRTREEAERAALSLRRQTPRRRGSQMPLDSAIQAYQ